ncbi:hypothetical protein GDO86_002620 [Hymenochirus boettgeri]|uniref:Uncharacterized protein n=1 Tax=Hymenochirus boettgeri TaxID=247094 RepID=A0A8T2K3V2_9PIPI|nr:hypothetical protein GDO86_002620 [Hymenochirus boettgeri]
MSGVKVKKRPRSGSDTEESLCCCEYINHKGERSHLVACLCDCQDVDDACDSYIFISSSDAFNYTCVWYCTIVTAGMGYILLRQLLNISYNITEREARVGLREGSGRSILRGLVVDTGVFNQGLFQNWRHFTQMESSTGGDVTDLV